MQLLSSEIILKVFPLFLFHLCVSENDGCLVLWRIISIVIYIDTLPPSAESKSKVLSGILHFLLIAFTLSDIVTMIDTRFISTR